MPSIAAPSVPSRHPKMIEFAVEILVMPEQETTEPAIFMLVDEQPVISISTITITNLFIGNPYRF